MDRQESFAIDVGPDDTLSVHHVPQTTEDDLVRQESRGGPQAWAIPADENPFTYDMAASTTCLQYLKMTIVGFTLFPIRMFVLIITCIVMYTVLGCASCCCLSDPVDEEGRPMPQRRPVLRWFVAKACRVIMWCFGFWWIPKRVLALSDTATMPVAVDEDDDQVDLGRLEHSMSISDQLSAHTVDGLDPHLLGQAHGSSGFHHGSPGGPNYNRSPHAMLSPLSVDGSAGAAGASTPHSPPQHQTQQQSQHNQHQHQQKSPQVGAATLLGANGQVPVLSPVQPQSQSPGPSSGRNGDQPTNPFGHPTTPSRSESPREASGTFPAKGEANAARENQGGRQNSDGAQLPGQASDDREAASPEVRGLARPTSNVSEISGNASPPAASPNGAKQLKPSHQQQQLSAPDHSAGNYQFPTTPRDKAAVQGIDAAAGSGGGGAGSSAAFHAIPNSSSAAFGQNNNNNTNNSGVSGSGWFGRGGGAGGHGSRPNSVSGGYRQNRSMTISGQTAAAAIAARKWHQSKRAPVVVCNHVGFIDTLFTVSSLDGPLAVGAVETLNALLVRPIARALQLIPVRRESKESCKEVAQEILRRTRWRYEQPPEVLEQYGVWQPLVVYPEGTISNGRSLLEFKPGAFLGGVPVQPIILKCPFKHLDPHWVGPSSVGSLTLKLMLQVYNNMEATWLPPVIPTQEEEADPAVFAERVRLAMAHVGGLKLADRNFLDVKLDVYSTSLGLPQCCLDRVSQRKVLAMMPDGTTGKESLAMAQNAMAAFAVYRLKIETSLLPPGAKPTSVLLQDPSLRPSDDDLRFHPDLTAPDPLSEQAERSSADVLWDVETSEGRVGIAAETARFVEGYVLNRVIDAADSRGAPENGAGGGAAMLPPPEMA